MDSRMEALSNASRPVRPGIAGSRSREKTRHCATATTAVFYVRQKFQQRHASLFYLKSVGPKSITVTEYNLDLIMLGPCTLLRRPFYFFLAGGPNLRGWKLNPAVFHFIYYSLVL